MPPRTAACPKRMGHEGSGKLGDAGRCGCCSTPAPALSCPPGTRTAWGRADDGRPWVMVVPAARG